MFVRGPGGWITCPWKYLDRVPVPFGDPAWDHVSGQLAGQGRGDASELERARAVDELLRRAYHGPPAPDPEAEQGPAGSVTSRARSRQRGGKPAARDLRVAARTRATSARDTAGTGGPAAGPAAAAPAGEAAACALPHDDQPVAKVIPLGIFDPFEEARKPW